MISENAKQEIDRMTREELVLEINKWNASRFQRDNFAYLQTRLNILDQRTAEDISTAQASLAKEANEIAREANNLSREANRTSSSAYRIAILAAIISLLAVLVALVPQCSHAP